MNKNIDNTGNIGNTGLSNSNTVYTISMPGVFYDSPIYWRNFLLHVYNVYDLRAYANHSDIEKLVASILEEFNCKMLIGNSSCNYDPWALEFQDEQSFIFFKLKFS